MRHLAAVACASAAVVSTGSATAALQPIGRALGEVGLQRVRPGNLPVQARDTRVIVTLGLPPLAEASGVRETASASSGKLNVSSSSARGYLARVDAAQRRAIAQLKASIPEAKVSWRYSVILNGFTVKLPPNRLPRLHRLSFVRKVYPSFSYAPAINRSPSLIDAPQLRAITGGRGDGVKVAVVDDGVDQANPFLSGTGYTAPAGFPVGSPSFTNQKVIVARSFPGPGSGVEGREPVDRRVSFHGTHVAGIIAGNENTTAPDSTVIPEEQTDPVCVRGRGGCIPEIRGLTGVAPRAWIGNYRVFTVPSPIRRSDCCSGNSPEIVAAFEAAVRDGMDVINFSGGGAQADPRLDVLIPATNNVARAGVVPVISAGNDRQLFGLGSVGSPSTAEEAISVAAVTNTHVFLPAMIVLSPALGAIPLVPIPGGLPGPWSTENQTLIDAAVVTGDATLCARTPPERAFLNMIVLVQRGGCEYDVKASRVSAAGGSGIVLVADYPGEADGVQFRLARPGGVIADVDGARLRAAMAASGGRAQVRFRSDVREMETGRGGTPTTFTAGGLTAFGHDLKPDLAAPGASILSSTVEEFAGSNFAVLDGTSFSAPHVAGAAALLVQQHPSWTSRQVKSALMSTAGPAWADTSRTVEAPVYLQGAGLVRLTEANSPKIFSDPQSLSFKHLPVGGSRSILVQLTDAGGGGGTWSVEIRPQIASAGANVIAPPSVTVPPGGSTTFSVVASASGDAAGGDDFGFLVLRQGGVTRRIPYGFIVSRPALAGAQTIPLRPIQSGDTRSGVDRARAYRWPTLPWGITTLLGIDQPVDEIGKEQVYHLDVDRPVANIGAVVVEPELRIDATLERLLNAPVHPWLLSALDENEVMGYAGTPVNVNGWLPDFLFDIAAAGTVSPLPGRYYFSVESGRDPFTGRDNSGPYVLRSWVNDVTKPRITLLTKTVSTGRPTIAFRTTDAGAGVDPLAVGINYAELLFTASQYDRQTGIAVVPLPREAFAMRRGRVAMKLFASDFQEAKNVGNESRDVMPNTRILSVRLTAVNRPTVTWLTPARNACVRGAVTLSVVANSPSAISSVGFYVGNRQIARVTKNAARVYSATWNATGKGKRTLTATVSDTSGREASAKRPVRVC